MRFLWKLAFFIAVCKAVHTASDTIMDTVHVDDASLCDDDWKRFDKYCFKFNRIEKDWNDASADCRRLGGNLASIHSKEQNDFLGDLSRETFITYWLIGLHDHSLDGIFVWDDGTDIDYTNWYPGEPDGDYNSGDCVSMSFIGNNLGAWYVKPCNSERPYLCQKKVTVATEATNTEVHHTALAITVITETDDTTIHTASDTLMDTVHVDDSSLCHDGWKRFDKYCFKLSRIKKDWNDASADCRRMGGNLASIHSTEQNDFLEDLSNETRITYWLIGLHDHALDGIFVWDDGTDIDYTNWSDGEPDGDYYSGDCVTMTFHDSNLGLWIVQPCDLELSYLCQKKVTVTTEYTYPEVDSRTLATTVITGTDDTTPTEVTVTKENDYSYNFISVTNVIITLILVIVFMVLMGGLIYYKRFRVKENRLKGSKVFFEGTKAIIDPSTEFTIETR